MDMSYSNNNKYVMYGVAMTISWHQSYHFVLKLLILDYSIPVIYKFMLH